VNAKRREWVGARSRLFLWAAISLGGARALAADAGWCEAQWVPLEVIPTDFEAVPYGAELKRWLELKGKCQGTGIYEVRLAISLADAGMIPEARETLAKLPATLDSKYRYLVDLAEIDIMVVEVFDQATDTLPGDKVQAIEDRFLSHMSTYYSDENLADAVEVTIAFGSFKGSLGEFEHAATLLEMADKMRKPARRKLALYRNLAVNYAQLGRFRHAEDAAQTALRISPIVMTSPNFVYALAKSQASLDMPEEARASMKKLAELRPDVVASVEFKDADSFVASKAKGR
jgi:tetratricopeptide (TPR) repeat protein